MNKSYEAYVIEQVGIERMKEVDEKLGNPTSLNFNSESFGKLIEDFSPIEKRIVREIPFIIKNTDIAPDSKIYDSCLGTGSTTIGLKLFGYEKIISGEIDPYLADYAMRKAQKFGIDLNIVTYDWRDLRRFRNNGFELVSCLGNSLTYLFKREDQVKSLQNFMRILKHGGQLVIDERNYPQILEGNFRNRGTGPYSGTDKVNVRAVYRSTDLVVLRYTGIGEKYRHENNIYSDLAVYPFKEGELESLLRSVGFRRIKKFSDYRKGTDNDAEFFTYIATK